MRSLIIALCLIVANVAKADSINFAWDPVTDGVDGLPVVGLFGYKLYISTTAGTYGTTAEATVTGASATVTKTAIGTYFAVVRAYNETGESANSNEVSFQVRAKVPNAPTQFKRVP